MTFVRHGNMRIGNGRFGNCIDSYSQHGARVQYCRQQRCGHPRGHVGACSSLQDVGHMRAEDHEI
eukprot:9507789-Alexandrium_andersonii.AAC.1